MTGATAPARDPNRGLLAGIGQFARRAESSIVVIGIVTIVASVIWGVLTRYISQKPAAWTGEVASIAFCWVGFIGAAFIYGGDSHPRIFDSATIARRLPRRVLEFLSFALQIVVLVAVCALALKQIRINMTNPTAVLRLPGSIFYLPIAWFGAASLVRLLFRR